MSEDHHAFIQIIISVGVSFVFFIIVFALTTNLIISLVISGICFLIYLAMAIIMYGDNPPPTREWDEEFKIQNIQKRKKVVKMILRAMSFLSLYVLCSSIILFIFYTTKTTLLLVFLGILFALCCVSADIYLSRGKRKDIKVKVKSRR